MAQGEQGGEATAKAERRVAGLQSELAEARADVERLTRERRDLAVKAKQLESKLERIEEERQGALRDRVPARLGRLDLTRRSYARIVDAFLFVTSSES